MIGGLWAVLMTHPEKTVPFMVRDFDLLDAADRVLLEIRNHRWAHFDRCFDSLIETTQLKLRIRSTHGAPAAVFRLRVL